MQWLVGATRHPRGAAVRTAWISRASCGDQCQLRGDRKAARASGGRDSVFAKGHLKRGRPMGEEAEHWGSMNLEYDDEPGCECKQDRCVWHALCGSTAL